MKPIDELEQAATQAYQTRLPTPEQLSDPAFSVEEWIVSEAERKTEALHALEFVKQVRVFMAENT